MMYKFHVAVLVAVTLVASAFAEQFEIQSFDSNGQLVFNQVSNASAYRVEWAPSPDGPWTNTWDDLDSMLAPAEHSVTCSVAMFYRVIAEMEIPMVEIPGGTNSGTNPLGSGESYDSTYPENYSLTVDTFYMDVSGVTKSQWDVVYSWANANGYTFDNPGSCFADNHPVYGVNWFDAAKWCNARSEKEGLTPCYTVSNTVYRIGQFQSPTCDFAADGYRLPTVEEYEYAARGGLVDQRFPWGDTITHDQINYNSSTNYSYDVSSTRGYHPVFGYSTAPVGSFASNGYGLYDMGGNLGCWCWEEAHTTAHHVRGGMFDQYADKERCGQVGWAGATTANFHYGFRCVQIKP